jgi:hypothetical protein
MLSGLMVASAAVANAEPADGPLDAGGYPTTPSAPLGLAGTQQAGARTEAQRLAAFVVGPWEVDPTLTESFTNSADVVDGPDALRSELPPELAEVGVRHNVIDGFSSGRRGPGKELRITVLRFADPQAAGAAVSDFAEAAANSVQPDGPVTSAAVPGYPETPAVTYPFVDGSGRKSTLVRSFTAHGPYMIMQLAGAAGGAEDAAALTAAALDRQAPLLDRFVLTPPALLPAQPLDPTGLLARLLPVPPADATPDMPGVYDARATLHFEDNPIVSAGRFADAGVTNWVNGLVSFYEARDAQAAQQISDHRMDYFAEYGTPAEPVAGVPGSRCLTLDMPELPEVRSFCSAVAERYALDTYGESLSESQQQVAAQYAMLTSR